MPKRIAGSIAALAVMVFSPTVMPQSYKQTHEQIFCNILGTYAAEGVADYYDHVPLEQSLRRTDGFICTDRIRKVCDARVSMIRESMQTWYAFAQEHQYETRPASEFATLNDAVKVNATSACWKGAKQHYGW